MGFGEANVEIARGVPGVAQAFGFVRGTLVPGNGSGEVLQLFGIDLRGEPVSLPVPGG